MSLHDDDENMTLHPFEFFTTWQGVVIDVCLIEEVLRGEDFKFTVSVEEYGNVIVDNEDYLAFELFLNYNQVEIL